MPDLNLSLDYFGHPKTNRLKGILGRGAELLPIRLWAYCGRYFAKDGRVIGHSPNEIEAVVEWWGKPGEAIEAMMRVGFLDFDGETYSAHDWKRHQGHIFALKKRNSLVAKNRWQNIKNKIKNDEKAVPTVDTSGIPRGIPKRTSGVPQPTNQLTDQPTVFKNKKNKSFIRPTPQQVSTYAKEIGFDLDGQYFVDKQDSVGWLVGKNRAPMRDWKAVVRTWKLNEIKNGFNNRKPTIPPYQPPNASKLTSIEDELKREVAQ